MHWKALQKSFSDFMNDELKLHSFLERYLQNIFYTLELIYLAEIGQHKKRYAKLFVSRLTPEEKYILFYVSLLHYTENPKLLYLIKMLDINYELFDSPVVSIDYHVILYLDCMEIVNESFYYERIPHMIIPTITDYD